MTTRTKTHGMRRAGLFGAPTVALAFAVACGDSGVETTADASGVSVASASVSASAGTVMQVTTGTTDDATQGGTQSTSDVTTMGATTASSGETMTASETGDMSQTGTTFPGTTSDTDTTTTGIDPCGDAVLMATIRDFSVGHPDFETFTGDAPYEGIVQTQIGGDMKPIYAHPGATPQTTGPAEFSQWYNDTPGVNLPFAIEIALMESMPGVYTYTNSAFFPIDDSGFGNEGQPHNFHFTTEIHTTFRYTGGESFTFTGDDDLWLFLNGELAIDLGGTHPEESATAELDLLADSLGIQPGGVYTMDIFHAERHTVDSNFRIDTTIGCFVPE